MVYVDHSRNYLGELEDPDGELDKVRLHLSEMRRTGNVPHGEQNGDSLW